MSRIEADPGSFRVICAGYAIECTPCGLPLIYKTMKAHAELVDEIGVGESAESSICCVAVRKCGEPWPFLVVAQSYSPAGSGFEPGCLLVADTGVIFIGAGERILVYQLEPPTRLWEDHADTGFLGWEQFGDIVLLAAELEFGAWSTAGKKLWTMFVEPPWEYRVRGTTVDLEVMGTKQSFGLRDGPREHGQTPRSG